MYTKKRLFPFITKVIIFYFGQILHHHIIQNISHGTPDQFCTTSTQNPSNASQTRPIETIWSLLEQKMYEGVCEAKINLKSIDKKDNFESEAIGSKRGILGVRRTCTQTVFVNIS